MASDDSSTHEDEATGIGLAGNDDGSHVACEDLPPHEHVTVGDVTVCQSPTDLIPSTKLPFGDLPDTPPDGSNVMEAGETVAIPGPAVDFSNAPSVCQSLRQELYRLVENELDPDRYILWLDERSYQEFRHEAQGWITHPFTAGDQKFEGVRVRPTVHLPHPTIIPLPEFVDLMPMHTRWSGRRR